jgi:TRAP-type C4-dicarboxylate transport system permease small subunit
VLNCLVALLSTALLAAIVWYSLGQARIQFAQGDKSMTLGIPMLVYWVPMLLGTALSIVATLLVAAREGARACGVEVKR